MSTVVTLKSMSKICHLSSSCLFHSLSVVCSVQWADDVSLKALCPSLPDLTVSVGGLGSWGDAVSLPPSILTSSLMMFSTGALGPVSIPVPSRGTPAGISSRIWMLTLLFQCPKGSWVPGMCAWAQEIPTNELSNRVRQILCRSSWAILHRPASPVLAWTWDPRQIPESMTELPKENRLDVLHVWSERVLERYPLWIAGDRQNTAAVFFTWGR